jgi:hypothetical protein
MSELKSAGVITILVVEDEFLLRGGIVDYLL